MIRNASFVSISRRLLLPAVGLLLLAAVSSGSGSQAPGSTAAPVRFRDVAVASGIDFVHQHSPTPEKHYVESAPGGLAVFDYNGDGRPDIFFTNGAQTPALEKTSVAFANRLFRNDGGMKFTDVTDASGVSGVGYAMGAAAGDYDNNGHVDLFVAGVRQNQLLRNRGDGRFEDVTTKAGITSAEWAVAGGWFDYDNDSRLDLFVVNYVEWSPDGRYCGDQGRGIRIYCHPRFFKGTANQLFRNRGDGTFEDVSARSGISKHVGKGMSVAFADYDHDGDVDAFVTNDTVPNFLFRNNGDGTFGEIALVAGVSVPSSGRPVSAMGVDFQDFDNDSWEDLHFTALSGETFPLFRNDGRGAFEEVTQSSMLAAATTRRAGWCTVFADVDNDGRKDIFTANSHANDRIGEFEGTAWRQANSLFMNLGAARFRDATAESGLAELPAVHRGCGFADFDADGDLDIAVLALGTRAELWRSDGGRGHNWLVVTLVGVKSNRDGIGARITVGNQTRTMATALGYASSSHAGAHFGLGSTSSPVRVEVHWPSGTKQVVDNVQINRRVEIKEQ